MELANEFEICSFNWVYTEKNIELNKVLSKWAFNFDAGPLSQCFAGGCYLVTFRS